MLPAPCRLPLRKFRQLECINRFPVGLNLCDLGDRRHVSDKGSSSAASIAPRGFLKWRSIQVSSTSTRDQGKGDQRPREVNLVWATNAATFKGFATNIRSRMWRRRVLCLARWTRGTNDVSNLAILLREKLCLKHFEAPNWLSALSYYGRLWRLLKSSSTLLWM